MRELFLPSSRVPGHRAGPLARTPSVGGPRLTGSHLAILNDASAGNAP